MVSDIIRLEEMTELDNKILGAISTSEEMDVSKIEESIGPKYIGKVAEGIWRLANAGYLEITTHWNVLLASENCRKVLYIRSNP